MNYYFDSYGTAVPDELREYICTRNKTESPKTCKIYRSYFMIQELNSDICGEFCLTVLHCMMKTNRSYNDIVLSLREK